MQKEIIIIFKDFRIDIKFARAFDPFANESLIDDFSIPEIDKDHRPKIVNVSNDSPERLIDGFRRALSVPIVAGQSFDFGVFNETKQISIKFVQKFLF